MKNLNYPKIVKEEKSGSASGVKSLMKRKMVYCITYKWSTENIPPGTGHELQKIISFKLFSTFEEPGIYFQLQII